MASFRIEGVEIAVERISRLCELLARNRISCRWQPGHRILRDEQGGYQEVNCPPPRPHQRQQAGCELAAWIAVCVVALLTSSAAVATNYPLPAAAELFVMIALVMSLALLGGMLIWAVLGGCR